MFLRIGTKHVGGTRVETAAKQSHNVGVFVTILIIPLPFVLELSRVERLVVGGVHVIDTCFEASIHDGQILVRKRHVNNQVRLVLAYQCHGLVHVIGIELLRDDGTVEMFFYPCSDFVAPANCS